MDKETRDRIITENQDQPLFRIAAWALKTRDSLTPQQLTEAMARIAAAKGRQANRGSRE